jgi:hypothetical protein
MSGTPFRSFSPDHFSDTPSWQRVREILGGNGGCFGLYGPRGSGKSWLMLQAIAEASRRGGLGLWFPCPSQYEPAEFLATLSDSLAKATERRCQPEPGLTRLLTGLEVALLLVVVCGSAVRPRLTLARLARLLSQAWAVLPRPGPN